MPHVIIKMASGRSDEEKNQLSKRIALAVMNVLGVSDDTISVGIEDVDPDVWMDTVFAPDIAGRRETLFKKPGYAEV